MNAHAHWARGAFDQLGPGPLRQFARVREQVPNALGGGEEDVGRTDFHRSVSLTPYYTVPMAMGKRKRTRQPTMWVATTDFSTAASHPFYMRLNQLLREHRFDDFAETECATFYAVTMGRPGLPPGIYFRLLLIGYFEGTLGALLSVVSALIDDAMTATWSHRRDHARSACLSFGFAVAESVA